MYQKKLHYKSLPEGSAVKTVYGYVKIKNKEHPNSANGWISEHTLVMSTHLGRPIRKGESIHHKNGIRSDNRIENLELWNIGQPAGQKVEDKIEWSKEFLESYGYTISN